MEITKLSLPAGSTAAGDDVVGRALSRCPRFKCKRFVMFSEIVEFHPDEREHVSGEGDESDENGCRVVQVKVVLTKKQLKQILASFDVRGSACSYQYQSAAGEGEQNLQQCVLVSAKPREGSSQIRWRPALSSIPEEIRECLPNIVEEILE